MTKKQQQTEKNDSANNSLQFLLCIKGGDKEDCMKMRESKVQSDERIINIMGSLEGGHAFRRRGLKRAISKSS